MYGWVPLLFTWNCHNIVNQWYPNTEWKGIFLFWKKIPARTELSWAPQNSSMCCLLLALTSLVLLMVPCPACLSELVIAHVYIVSPSPSPSSYCIWTVPPVSFLQTENKEVSPVSPDGVSQNRGCDILLAELHDRDKVVPALLNDRSGWGIRMAFSHPPAGLYFNAFSFRLLRIINIL